MKATVLFSLGCVLALTACSTPRPAEPLVITRAYAKPLVVDARPALPFLDNSAAWLGRPAQESAAALLSDIQVLDAYTSYLLRAIDQHNARLTLDPAPPAAK